MALNDRGQDPKRALGLARAGEAERIAAAIRSNRVVGVLGEAGVGKTETIQQAAGRPAAGAAALYLDLDGAASEGHLAFLIAQQVVHGLLGAAGFSALSARALVPADITARRGELAELLGADGLEEALRMWPSGDYSLDDALAAVEGLAADSEVLLWVDHIEAPALTPRHPLANLSFLWGLREMSQRVEGLRLVISAREGAGKTLLGRRAPFHQQGEWITLDNPPAAAWSEVARRLRAPLASAEALAQLTAGHPGTMLLALLQTADRGLEEPAADTLRRLAILDPGLVARSLQHARSLHRLGGQVLQQVVLGLGPYAEGSRGAASRQEVTKVLNRLRLAGLIRHDGGWSPVNPLLRIALSGEAQRISAASLESRWPVAWPFGP